MRSTKVWMLIVVTGILLLSGCAKKQATYEQYVDENGVRVTKNTTTPADPALTIELKEIGFIDNENETDSVRFIEALYYTGSDDKENLYILDSKRSRVHKYNNAYKFVSCFGGKGEGPGEFMYAGNICIKKDTIYIPDWYSKKINKYDLEGNPLSIKKYDDIDKIPTHPRTFGDHFINSSMNSKTISSAPGIVYRSAVASLYDQRLNFIKDIYTLTWEFNKTEDYDPTANGVTSANSDTELYLAEKSKEQYLISVHDNSGKRIREIRKQFTRIRINEEESQKLAEKGEKYKMKYKMTYKSSINNLNVDKYGRLWVNVPVANSDKLYYDIFKDDIYQNRIMLKLEEGYNPQFVGNKILAINEDNNNIKVYEY